MRMVIYPNLDGYSCTTESNYNSRISDARKIHNFTDVEPQDIIDIYKKYYGMTEEDFIVKERA